MAACGMKLHHMFEKTLPDNPTLIESLSWNHHNHVHQSASSSSSSSFTEIFGELYFNEQNSHSSPPPLPFMPCTDANQRDEPPEKHESKKSGEESRNFVQFSRKCYAGNHKVSDSYSSMSSTSLQLCTEGLGFESSDNSDDLETQDYWHKAPNKVSLNNPPCGEVRRPKVRRGPFPPPISCIGKSGKPWVYFKSYKNDGRFVLKEIMIPSQECLHASREDGRLKLHFVHKEDDCDYPAIYEKDQEKED